MPARPPPITPPKGYPWTCKTLFQKTKDYCHIDCSPVALSPSEILLPDEEAEWTAETRATKKRKIEKLTKSFLDGQPLNIQSARPAPQVLVQTIEWTTRSFDQRKFDLPLFPEEDVSSEPDFVEELTGPEFLRSLQAGKRPPREKPRIPPSRRGDSYASRLDRASEYRSLDQDVPEHSQDQNLSQEEARAECRSGQNSIRPVPSSVRKSRVGDLTLQLGSSNVSQQVDLSTGEPVAESDHETDDNIPEHQTESRDLPLHTSSRGSGYSQNASPHTSGLTGLRPLLPPADLSELASSDDEQPLYMDSQTRLLRSAGRKAMPSFWTSVNGTGAIEVGDQNDMAIAEPENHLEARLSVTSRSTIHDAVQSLGKPKRSRRQPVPDNKPPGMPSSRTERTSDAESQNALVEMRDSELEHERAQYISALPSAEGDTPFMFRKPSKHVDDIEQTLPTSAPRSDPTKQKTAKKQYRRVTFSSSDETAMLPPPPKTGALTTKAPLLDCTLSFDTSFGRNLNMALGDDQPTTPATNMRMPLVSSHLNAVLPASDDPGSSVKKALMNEMRLSGAHMQSASSSSPGELSVNPDDSLADLGIGVANQRSNGNTSKPWAGTQALLQQAERNFFATPAKSLQKSLDASTHQPSPNTPPTKPRAPLGELGPNPLATTQSLHVWQPWSSVKRQAERPQGAAEPWPSAESQEDTPLPKYGSTGAGFCDPQHVFPNPGLHSPRLRQSQSNSTPLVYAQPEDVSSFSPVAATDLPTNLEFSKLDSPTARQTSQHNSNSPSITGGSNHSFDKNTQELDRMMDDVYSFVDKSNADIRPYLSQV